MKRRAYPYKKVDAFTSEHSLGNPAAYLWLENEELTPEDMLSVGKEHKGFVSEVVFAQTSKVADVKLTYYSSECEVDFCGHGTIATMYDLIHENANLKKNPVVTIETNRKGNLSVYNRLEEEDAIYITAPEPISIQVPMKKEEIADALGVSEHDFSTEYPFDYIDAGLRTLLVPIQQFKTEVHSYPDMEHLRFACKEHGIDIVLMFCKETKEDISFAHTRVFAPKFGYLEDPATGSGNSAFAAYLLKNRLWDGTPIVVEQGGDNIEYNTVKLCTKDGNILFGGKATVKIEGTYYL